MFFCSEKSCEIELLPFSPPPLETLENALIHPRQSDKRCTVCVCGGGWGGNYTIPNTQQLPPTWPLTEVPSSVFWPVNRNPLNFH